MTLKLTEEGKQYLERGLPEKNLVELLKKGPVNFNNAQKRIQNFPIALQWAKKNNWIEIKQGKISLVKIPEDIPEQQALFKISQRREREVSEELIKKLIQRNLVEEERETLEIKAKRLVGQEVTNIAPELIKTGLWKEVRFRPYNVEVVGKRIYLGKRQPYNQFLQRVRQKLIELGFKEMTGPTIELEFWNFDALFQPQNHPARDWTQTYSLKQPKFGELSDKKLMDNVRAAHEVGVSGGSGWGYKWNPKKALQLMPRAHGTCLSARTLASKLEISGKYFAISRCYRPDVIDAIHGVEFNQVEGIVLDESLNFKNLLALLEMFAKEIAGAKKVKFINDYYPFTEPSVQLSALHPQLGWIEFAGSGIFREELTKPLGIDIPVIAWGIGIDRLAMFKLGINDIRYLFSQNLDWLRNQKVV